MNKSPIVAFLLMTALLAASGCNSKAAVGAVTTTPTLSAADTARVTSNALAVTTTATSNSLAVTTTATSNALAATTTATTPVVPPAGVPTCAADLPDPPPNPDPTALPPEDTCVIASGEGAPSPGCPTTPTTVIVDGKARTGTPEDSVDNKSGVDGFGRWGGRHGSSMCFASYRDGSVDLTNGMEMVLVEGAHTALIYAGRTHLARSDGVWGAVRPDVVSVTVRDAARPAGFRASLHTVKAAQFFVEPVTPGPVTVTAFDAAGQAVGSVSGS